MKIRFALVGAGAWGQNYVRAAEDSGEARITSVISREQLSDPPHRWLSTVDAVVVATHPRDSVNVAVRCLALGKPVLIEKPAGLSLRDAERLASAEEQIRGLVLVGHQHLHSEGMEQLRAAAVDMPVYADVAFGGPGPTRDYPALWDYGPHAVSAALALLDHDAIATRAKKGSFVMAGDRGHVHCRVGSDWPRKTALAYSIGVGGYDGYAPAEPALTRQVRAFAHAVRARAADPRCPLPWQFGARWAVDVARMLEAADGKDGYSRG